MVGDCSMKSRLPLLLSSMLVPDDIGVIKSLGAGSFHLLGCAVAKNFEAALSLSFGGRFREHSMVQIV